MPAEKNTKKIFFLRHISDEHQNEYPVRNVAQNAQQLKDGPENHPPYLQECFRGFANDFHR